MPFVFLLLFTLFYTNTWNCFTNIFTSTSETEFIARNERIPLHQNDRTAAVVIFATDLPRINWGTVVHIFWMKLKEDRFIFLFCCFGKWVENVLMTGKWVGTTLSLVRIWVLKMDFENRVVIFHYKNTVLFWIYPNSNWVRGARVICIHCISISVSMERYFITASVNGNSLSNV